MSALTWASYDDGVCLSKRAHVKAIEHIIKMRGGSQAHLMRCSDGHFYVVKFKNNPQHIRTLVNELLAVRLMEKLDLPTTPAAIVDVSQRLIDRTPDLVVDLPRHRVPCSSGFQFGSRYFGNPHKGWVLENVAPDELSTTQNWRDFAGMVVFDKWTCNCDGRQFVFCLREGTKYSMVGIDQGFCFNSVKWTFPDAPLRGLYGNKTVYRNIKGMDDFEPWLSRLENEMKFEDILEAAKGIPTEWYESDYGPICRLLEHLNRRRILVRELVRHSCVLLPLIFPRWKGDIAGRLVAIQGEQLRPLASKGN